MEGGIVLSGWGLGIIIISALSIGAGLGMVFTSIIISGTREPIDEAGGASVPTDFIPV